MVRRRLCALAIPAALLAACAAPGTRGARDHGALSPPAEAWLIGAARSTESIFPADLARDQGTSVYARTTDDARAAEGLVEIRLRHEADGTVSLLRSRLGAGGVGATLERADVLVAAGGIAIVRTDNTTEAVVVEFDPPLLSIPERLEPGVAVAHTSRMVVRPAARPDRVRARGSVRQTIGFDLEGTVRTPAGDFRAFRVVSEFNADLGATKVENRTETWLAPGVGIVAERRTERTTLLGVGLRSGTETLLLRSLSRE